MHGEPGPLDAEPFDQAERSSGTDADFKYSVWLRFEQGPAL
jgi:hypothetical protein